MIPTLQAQRALQDEWNSNPDDFWHLLPRRFAETSAALASRLLHARAEDVFVVENLTVGMAALAHSLIANITQPGSIVLMSNHTYNAVQLAVKHCCSLASSRMGHSVDILMVDLPFPVLSADHDNIFLDRYAAALDSVPSGKVVRYAFLDHITSVPSMKMPVQRLVKLLRDRGVLEVILNTQILLSTTPHSPP